MLIASPKFKIHSLMWILLPILLLALVGGVVAWRVLHTTPPVLPNGAMPTNPAIEERWGIRITQIGVTADGGLVDFRYIALDPDKALAMLQNDKNLPTMIAEDGGTVINSATLMAHKHDLTAGRTYFLLYRNTGGAIKPGGAVTVTIGDLRLEHVIAK